MVTLLSSTFLVRRPFNARTKASFRVSGLWNFHWSSFDPDDVAFDFDFVGRRLSICLICAGVLPRTS
jgi:hypothetical protein